MRAADGATKRREAADFDSPDLSLSAQGEQRRSAVFNRREVVAVLEDDAAVASRFLPFG